MSSSNQAVIPVAGSISGSALTVVPNPVLADTVVTLTVRDTGTTPTQNATVTVRPGTVNNDITITPSSTQGGSCTPAICSGGDALVSATLSQGGIPLPARGVRFEVVSGDFLFITSDPGSAIETLATSITVITDETGKARARIRAAAAAPNQTALLQVTDLATGTFQRTSFVIAQATGTSPGFFVTPDALTFQGSRVGQCANSSISAVFYIFGGAPPYAVLSTTSAFFVSSDQISLSGGSFIVTPNGACVDEPGAPIVIRDASGRTVTVTVANIPGTAAGPLVVGPNPVTLSSCASIASVTALGGTGNYVANSGSGSVMVTGSSGTFSIQRVNPSPAPSGSGTNVTISDGISTVVVTVNYTGSATGACVTLTDCTGTVTVTISGGTLPYSAVSDNTSVMATVGPPAATATTVTIQRRPTSGAFTPPATVTVSDASTPAKTVLITVNATGTGVGTGGGTCP